MAKTKTKKKPPYHLEISLNDNVFKGDGEDMLSILKSYQAPDIIKTRVIFNYSKDGGKVFEKVFFQASDIKRNFVNPHSLILLASTLTKELA
jgi:hypothetical protein